VEVAWTAAADRATRLSTPSIYRDGQMVSSHRVVVPERWVHAVPPEGHRALCGRPVHALYSFAGLLFVDVGAHLRCRACDESAGKPRK
jgi:hypothetical protein